MRFLFPVAMIVFDIGAAVVSLFDGDYKRAIYWFAAAVLNAAVTF